jgi:CRISPR-associated protein Cas1
MKFIAIDDSSIMPVVYLTTPGIRATLSGERLEVYPPKMGESSLKETQWVPLIDIERVVVDAGVHLSSRSITGLLEYGVPLLFIRHGSRPAGFAVPTQRQILCLADQLDLSRDSAFRMAVSTRLVSAKVRNMRRVIQRLSSNRSLPTLVSQWMGSMISQIEAVASMDSLRGLEGATSGRYFEVISSFFPEDVPFERRSRRPPLNEANALLSFAYTLLCSEFTLYLHSIGLEPGWGIYHESEDGRPALALDLMEPFRSPLADALVLDLLNHRRIKKDDFEYLDGGFLLKSDCRKKVYAAWEERLEREFMYEQKGHRTSLRQLISDCCMSMKQAFRMRDPSLVRPFLMN